MLDGHIVLGSCDITGRLWTGSLWYYRDPQDAPSVQKALTGVDCDSGVIDGKFIGNRNKDVRKLPFNKFYAFLIFFRFTSKSLAIIDHFKL